VDACDRALRRYTATVGIETENELVDSVIAAMAATATAGEYLDADAHRRDVALRVAVDACVRAGARCRAHGLDRELLLCAAACDRAAAQATLVLESPVA
jgi:hypothetical protein